MTMTDTIHQAVLKIPKKTSTPAYDAGGTERPGARVAETTGVPDLSTWPKVVRLIVRKERPHPGEQLHFTDLDGLRLTCFATNTQSGQLADLELRHRGRARREDRIETPATRDCATCPCTTPHRTRSGWRSSPSHSTSSPGCPCSPSPVTPAASLALS
jgi:hypothetical protein